MGNEKYGRALILNDINAERVYQDSKHPQWPEGNGDRLAILTEEVGGVAKGIQDKDLENLRHELIQVAAVAVRWVEVLDKATNIHIGKADMYPEKRGDV